MAQGQETQEAYKFPQKGRDLDTLFQRLFAWITQGLGLSGVGNLTIPKLFLGSGDVELTSKNLGGELYFYNEEGEEGGTLAELYASEYYAGNHRLTSKANSSDVVSAKAAQSFTNAQRAQARTNIGAASQSDLNSTNQEVAKKAEVIDLQQYVGKRVPTCDYEFMENYMPHYTYGEYPIQWGIVEDTNEESNNDFYYVGRYTSDGGLTFSYLSFSNKGDWGFMGGSQGFFTEDNVPEALKQAIYAYSLSKDTVYDAQPATLASHPVRTVKEGGTIIFPVSHSGAIFHDTELETTVEEEIDALKQKNINVYTYIGANKTLPVIGAYSYYYNGTIYPDQDRKINVFRFAFPIDDEDGRVIESSDDYGYFYVWYDDLSQKIYIWESNGDYYNTYTEQGNRGSGNYRNSQNQQLPYVVLRALNIGNVSVMGGNGFTDTQKAQARTNIGALGEITQEQFDAIFNFD